MGFALDIAMVVLAFVFYPVTSLLWFLERRGYEPGHARAFLATMLGGTSCFVGLMVSYLLTGDPDSRVGLRIYFTAGYVGFLILFLLTVWKIRSSEQQASK